jgi:hypothetical protein
VCALEKECYLHMAMLGWRVSLLTDGPSAARLILMSMSRCIKVQVLLLVCCKCERSSIVQCT